MFFYLKQQCRKFKSDGTSEYTEPIKQWWTDDQSRMTKVTDMRESPYFFIGGFIKWHYILSLITTLLFVSIERSFACYFLNDYEKKSRNLFFFLLIFGQFSMNMVAAFLFFFNAAHFAVGLAYILSANLIAMGVSNSSFPISFWEGLYKQKDSKMNTFKTRGTNFLNFRYSLT